MGLAVVLETGTSRSFAAAVDWPGWARSGKGDDAAVAALLAYAPRYAEVAGAAGLSLPTGATAVPDIVERLPGDMTTNFGAPGAVADADRRRQTRVQGRRAAALVSASWDLLDRVAATAPAVLRKGPRGGGRDRDAIVAHVVSAEAAYARKIGLRMRAPDPDDRAAVEESRLQLLEALAAASDGTPVGPKGWPLRYAARRIAWHVLDHAWEIQDRTHV